MKKVTKVTMFKLKNLVIDIIAWSYVHYRSVMLYQRVNYQQLNTPIFMLSHYLLYYLEVQRYLVIVNTLDNTWIYKSGYTNSFGWERGLHSRLHTWDD